MSRTSKMVAWHGLGSLDHGGDGHGSDDLEVEVERLVRLAVGRSSSEILEGVDGEVTVVDGVEDGGCGWWLEGKEGWDGSAQHDGNSDGQRGWTGMEVRLGIMVAMAMEEAWDRGGAKHDDGLGGRGRQAGVKAGEEEGAEMVVIGKKMRRKGGRPMLKKGEEGQQRWVVCISDGEDGGIRWAAGSGDRGRRAASSGRRPLGRRWADGVEDGRRPVVDLGEEGGMAVVSSPGNGVKRQAASGSQQGRGVADLRWQAAMVGCTGSRGKRRWRRWWLRANGGCGPEAST